MNDVATFVTTAIAESCCADPASLAPETQLADLGLDSLVMTSLVSLVEAAYPVDLSPEEVLEMYQAVSLGDMVNLIVRVIEATPGAAALTPHPISS